MIGRTYAWVGCSLVVTLTAGCGGDVEPEIKPGADKSIAVDDGLDSLPYEKAVAPDGREDPVFSCDLEPGLQEVALMHEGEERVFDVVVPEALDERAPLAVDFHGFTSNKDQQRFLSNSDAVGGERGYVVAYPQGAGNPASWNAGACCAAQDPRDDVAFAKLIVGHLAARGCVDRARVYAMGLSNGGFLAHRLACEAADVFAAVAPVAGVLGVDVATCAPYRPMSVLHTHGRLDTVVPYAGSPLQGFPSVDDTILHWLSIDGCDPAQYEQSSEQGRTCTRYSACDADAAVELCTYEFAGHIWPGGAETTRKIFDFFDAVTL